MKMRVYILMCAGIVMAAVFVNSCKRSGFDSYPAPTPAIFSVPPGFPQPTFDFAGGSHTNEAIELGRSLFYDSRLSKFNDVNCGSCHQQRAAFTQFDHDLGHGTNHQHTTRNPPGIFNMAWHSAFEWDGAVPTLDGQVTACIEAPEKMGETPASVVSKISGDAAYREAFGKAYGKNDVTGEGIVTAVTQFVASIVSADSRYDKMKRGQVTFNASEEEGYKIFIEKCNSCHTEPLFTDHSFRNVGLAVSDFHPDWGRMHVTGNTSDSLKFKVPSLRNVGFSGYFTHDGRFSAFSEMLTHYSTGIQAGPTLDPLLKGGIPLSDLEKFYLQEFLFALDDSTMINEVRYARP